jgi:hypothetical protein
MSKEFVAEQLFNAYNEHGATPWKTFDGRDVPRWEGLNDAVREKWVAVALAARPIVADELEVTCRVLAKLLVDDARKIEK